MLFGDYLSSDIRGVIHFTPPGDPHGLPPRLPMPCASRPCI
jgi:hypothetical protein